MAESITLLIVSLGFILAGAELFTNGIEWFGHKLQLAEGATGSVLAAVGTALPETMIPIVAILFNKGAGHEDIGIGAILGAPLMLSTLAFFVSGLAVFVYTAQKRRTTRMTVDPVVLGRDLRTFFMVYSVAIASSFLPSRILKIPVAIFLLVAYGMYVRRTFADCDEDVCNRRAPGRLHFHRRAESPRLRVITSQVFVSLVLIVGGAAIFVNSLSTVALASGVSALVLATIIAPIATELPEKLNSVIWLRRRKDTLAIGNISGAMVFQSSIPTAIGMLFTNWILTPQALTAGAVTLAATFFAWCQLKYRKRLSPHVLLMGSFFYVIYLLCTFLLHPGK
jgi:cation:H+ antiporter